MNDHKSRLPELHFQQGSLHLSVCPALGGAITGFTLDGLDLLRPWDGTDSVRRAGCFTLAPYSNRIGDGCFSYDGQEFSLRLNSPDHALPIHGVGWKRAWEVVHQDAQGLTMSLTHRAEGEGALDWPFSFRLEQTLRLDEGGLSLTLRLHNLDHCPAPAGLGWHPYFPRHDGIQLQFEAESVWLSDQEQLPDRSTAIPSEWDFRQQREINEPGLDNCFAGWKGDAHVCWPKQGVDLKIQAGPALGHLVVFTPPAAMGVIAVEPVSHANNALNMLDVQSNGMQRLAPGEAMHVECKWVVTRNQ